MIKCDNVCVLEEKFVRSLEDEIKEMNLPVKLETNFAANIDEEANDAKLELLMEVGECELEQRPFYYKIVIAGIFSWYDVSKEEAEQEISLEGAEILCSFARTYFYEMLKKSNLNPIVMPLLKS